MDAIRARDCQRVLNRPRINPRLDHSALIREYYIRLRAAIDYYGYTFPAEGIHNAFLMLLLEKPSFQLDKIKVPRLGAPRKPELAATREMLVRAVKEVGRTNDKGVLTKAVKKVHKELSRREEITRQRAERWPDSFRASRTPSQKRLFNILTSLRREPLEVGPKGKCSDEQNYVVSDALATARSRHAE